MMNWVIAPPPADPPSTLPPQGTNLNLEAANQKNNLMNSKKIGGGLDDLRIEDNRNTASKIEDEASIYARCNMEEDDKSTASSNYMSVHLALPGGRKQDPAAGGSRRDQRGEEDEDTESEDTLQLMREAEKAKTKARPNGSIVDRMIKSSLSPAPGAQEEAAPAPDIDRLLQDLSIQEDRGRRRRPTGDDVKVVRTIEEAELKIAAEKVRIEV